MDLSRWVARSHEGEFVEGGRTPRTHVRGYWLILGLWLGLAGVCAAAPTPERAKELRARFKQGCKFVEQNQLEPALGVFAEILQEDPQARGSLLMSGLVENRRFRFTEAAGFFGRFLALEPNHGKGLIGAVKALEGAGRGAEAAPYRERLHALRAKGDGGKLRAMASYEREIIPMAGGRWVSVQEYFDEAELKPRWAFLLMKNEQVIARRVQLNLLPEAEARTLRGGNPALGTGKVYALSEEIRQGGEFKRVKIHRLLGAGSAYPAVRGMALEILGVQRGE